jgi:hypothetical protein
MIETDWFERNYLSRLEAHPPQATVKSDQCSGGGGFGSCADQRDPELCSACDAVVAHRKAALAGKDAVPSPTKCECDEKHAQVCRDNPAIAPSYCLVYSEKEK